MKTWRHRLHLKGFETICCTLYWFCIFISWKWNFIWNKLWFTFYSVLYHSVNILSWKNVHNLAGKQVFEKQEFLKLQFWLEIILLKINHMHPHPDIHHLICTRTLLHPRFISLNISQRSWPRSPTPSRGEHSHCTGSSHTSLAL